MPDPRATNLDLGQSGTAEESSFASSGSDASITCKVRAGMEGTDALRTAERLGFPIVQAEREAAPRGQHARIELPQTRCHKGRGDRRGLGRPIWLSQFPALTCVISCAVEDGSKDRASVAPPCRCEDHAAALLAQCERGSDACSRCRSPGYFGQQNRRKRTESGLSSFRKSELKPLKCGGQGRS